MNAKLLPLVLAAAVAVAGCDRRNQGGVDDTAVAPNDNLLGAAGADAASNPASPAYFQQTIGDRVLFPVDQYSLTAQAQAVLDGQAQWLLANVDYNAVIEGHADEQGTREYNLALGSRRANAVREYLVARGVPAGRIQTVTYGKERPIAICSDEACYSSNRRSVTLIAAGAAGV